MNKKSQVGMTMTWVVAFIVIFFILILFLAIVSGLAAKRNVPLISLFYDTSSSLEISKEAHDDISANKELTRFLESPVQYNGEPRTMKEFLILSKDKLFSVPTTPDGNLNFIQIKANQEYADFTSFYTSTASFFDKTYNKCYVVCLFRNDLKKQFKVFYPPRVVGGWCPLGAGALGPGGKAIKSNIDNIFERRPNSYDCDSLSSDLNSEVWKRLYDYAETITVPGDAQMEIKLFVGDKIIPIT